MVYGVWFKKYTQKTSRDLAHVYNKSMVFWGVSGMYDGNERLIPTEKCDKNEKSIYLAFKKRRNDLGTN